MTISSDVHAVVQYLDHYSGNSLRKRDDIAVILEVAAARGDVELVASLAFHGSALWKVYNVLRKQPSQAEGTAGLEREFAASMNEIRLSLLALSQHCDDDVSARFHDVYLAETSGAMRNLNDLAHDLAQFKDMQNDARRNTEQSD